MNGVSDDVVLCGGGCVGGDIVEGECGCEGLCGGRGRGRGVVGVVGVSVCVDGGV